MGKGGHCISDCRSGAKWFDIPEVIQGRPRHAFGFPAKREGWKREKEKQSTVSMFRLLFHGQVTLISLEQSLIWGQRVYDWCLQNTTHTTFFSCQPSSSARWDTLAFCESNRSKNIPTSKLLRSVSKSRQKGFTKANGKNMTSYSTEAHHLIFPSFPFGSLTFRYLTNVVIITDKDSSKLNIWFTHCSWGERGRRERMVSTRGYITGQRKLSRWICWHFFFYCLLATGPCSRAVDSLHKYMGYWLNTNNPSIPSDVTEIVTFLSAEWENCANRSSNLAFPNLTLHERLCIRCMYSEPNLLLILLYLIPIILSFAKFAPTRQRMLVMNDELGCFLTSRQFSTGLSKADRSPPRGAFMNLWPPEEASCLHIDLHCTYYNVLMLFCAWVRG